MVKNHRNSSEGNDDNNEERDQIVKRTMSDKDAKKMCESIQRKAKRLADYLTCEVCVCRRFGSCFGETLTLKRLYVCTDVMLFLQPLHA